MSEPIHLTKDGETVTMYAPTTARLMMLDGWTLATGRRVPPPSPADAPVDAPVADEQPDEQPRTRRGRRT